MEISRDRQEYYARKVASAAQKGEPPVQVEAFELTHGEKYGSFLIPTPDPVLFDSSDELIAHCRDLVREHLALNWDGLA